MRRKLRPGLKYMDVIELAVKGRFIAVSCVSFYEALPGRYDVKRRYGPEVFTSRLYRQSVPNQLSNTWYYRKYHNGMLSLSVSSYLYINTCNNDDYINPILGS